MGIIYEMITPPWEEGARWAHVWCGGEGRLVDTGVMEKSRVKLLMMAVGGANITWKRDIYNGGERAEEGGNFGRNLCVFQ